MKKKVLFVQGIWTTSKFFKKWKNYFDNLGYESICLSLNYYNYSEIDKMQILTDEIVKILESEKNLTVVCHSFGGILFNSALNNSKKHNIKKAIFFACPFRINIFGMRKRKNILGYNKNLKFDFENFSLGAYFDHFVPAFASKYKNEPHKNYFVDHMYLFGFKQRVFEKIFKFCKIKEDL